MHWCAWVCASVRRLAWVWAGVQGYSLVSACVWDEFSEFLPENSVPTSADFNTYPIRIFLVSFNTVTPERYYKTRLKTITGYG